MYNASMPASSFNKRLDLYILTVTNEPLICVFSTQYSGRLSHHSDTIKAGVLEKESVRAGQGTPKATRR